VTALPDAEELTIADQGAQGKIGGGAWKVLAGKAEDAGDSFSVTLYGEALADACADDSAATGDRVLLSLPKTVSTVDVDITKLQVITMVDMPDAMNYVSGAGKMAVTAVSATEVSGGLVASFNEDNEVNGKFTIPVCP